MLLIENVIHSMITISDQELATFLSKTRVRVFKKNEILSPPGQVPPSIFFIKQGKVVGPQNWVLSNLPRITPDRWMMRIKTHLASLVTS